MSGEAKKKNKIIGISLGLLVVLIIVISSAYAYWQITAHQEDTNVLKAACLNFEVDFEKGLTFEDEWPLPTSEAMNNLTGYKFTITNNCQDAVNYEIGLESLNDDKITDYMDYKYVALGIDDYYLGTYEGLEDLTGPTANPRASKKLMTSTLGAGEVKEHILRIWIDAIAPVEMQSKGFVGKLFVTGGQNITLSTTKDECFTMDGNEIIGYNESCGTSVVIPASVDGVAVKTIDSNAFKNPEPVYKYYNSSILGSGGSIDSVNTMDFSSANLMYVFDNYTEDTSMDLSIENIAAKSLYVAKLTTDAPVNSTLDQMGPQYGIDLFDADEIPELEAGQIAVYSNLEADLSGDTIGAKYYKENIYSNVEITSLDLSQALNLEKVEEYAFTNVPKGITDLSDLENYPISLTSLNFGNNSNNIKLGQGAFARIDVDKLSLYSTYSSDNITLADLSNIYIDAFYGANINELKIMATAEKTVMDDVTNNEGVVYNNPLAKGIIANKVVVDENIKHISREYFGEASIDTFIATENITVGDGNEDNGPDTGLYKAVVNKLILPTNATSIHEGAFDHATIKNVTIPSKIKTIGDSAFNGSKIENVTFEDTMNNPSQLERIGGYAFKEIAVKELTIPSTVSYIGDEAFRRNTISTLIFEDTAENPSQLEYIGIGAFGRAEGSSNGTVYLPSHGISYSAFSFTLPGSGWNIIE